MTIISRTGACACFGPTSPMVIPYVSEPPPFTRKIRVVSVLLPALSQDVLSGAPHLRRCNPFDKNVSPSPPRSSHSRLNRIHSFISMFFGYYFARKDLFPRVATRGASQVAVNLALPPLIFSSIVPAFTEDNVSAIGPTFLIAFIYGILGLCFGLIIREVCYVPRNFWQGIIVACCLGNWGSLRT